MVNQNVTLRHSHRQEKSLQLPTTLNYQLYTSEISASFEKLMNIVQKSTGSQRVCTCNARGQLYKTSTLQLNELTVL